MELASNRTVSVQRLLCKVRNTTFCARLLASCELFRSPSRNSPGRECKSGLLDDNQRKVRTASKGLSENAFQRSFQAWQNPWKVTRKPHSLTHSLTIKLIFLQNLFDYFMFKFRTIIAFIILIIKLTSVYSVSKPTCMTSRPGFDTRQGQEFQITEFWQALGPTYPPTHWVSGALGVKRPRREADHSLSRSTEIKNGEAIPPFPHTSSWLSA
jgi:hypothetical protein